MAIIIAVLFDLDGTLLDRERSLRAFIFNQHDRLEALRHIPKGQYAARFIELDAHGQIWKDSVYQTLVSEFSISGTSWQKLLEDYETGFARECVRLPGLVTTLTTLHANGYRLGLISNGRSIFQRRVIHALGIEHFFPVILVSETEGVRKPDPEIFHRALQRMRVSPGQSVFVGDHPVADIAGAKSAGMKAVWMRNFVWPTPEVADGIIDELSQLPAIIRSLT